MGKGDRTLCLVIELYFTHKIYLFMIWRSEAKARKSNLNSFASARVVRQRENRKEKVGKGKS